ncbi:hypothetical protein GCM10011571_12700 [Marinithermofilum abyssi]|uniref:Dicarboxylate carrier MatC N-terminal domain-containing protein n=2 Tax=Marinithermofilum abyssi TaxID=1571185 RepID=A0A8J2VDK7_9BACL|nr:hypothetical protein GCM10011571_12700 [Marinithermofilum abyssi]
MVTNIVLLIMFDIGSVLPVNLGLIPWVMFGLCTMLTSVGTLGPAAAAILAPIALRFATKFSVYKKKTAFM